MVVFVGFVVFEMQMEIKWAGRWHELSSQIR